MSREWNIGIEVGRLVGVGETRGSLWIQAVAKAESPNTWLWADCWTLWGDWCNRTTRAPEQAKPALRRGWKEEKLHEYKQKQKPKRYCVCYREAVKIHEPDISCFRRSAIRGTRVESFDGEKTCYVWVGFDRLRDDRREVTLSTGPYDWCVFWRQPWRCSCTDEPLLATEANFRASMGAFVCSRWAKPRGPAIKGYYAKLTPPHVGWIMQLKVIPSFSADLNTLYKSDTWFD